MVIKPKPQIVQISNKAIYVMNARRSEAQIARILYIPFVSSKYLRHTNCIYRI